LRPQDRLSAYRATETFAPRVDLLPPAQAALWPQLAEIPLDFVLYGGTALALRLGHRTSVDFDLFSPRGFEPEELRQAVPFAAGGVVLQREANTLTVRTPAGVTVTFLGGIGWPAVRPPDLARSNGVLVASLPDLGAAKVGAIVGRAEARDYLDLFALLEHGIDLPTLLGAAAATHGPQLNLMLALKALAYFADGDLPSLPEAVRARLASEAAAVREIPSVRPASASILGGLLG